MAGTIVNVSTIKNTVTVDTSSAMRKLDAFKKKLSEVNKLKSFKRNSASEMLAEKREKVAVARAKAEKETLKEQRKNERLRQKSEKEMLKRQETVKLGRRKFGAAGFDLTDKSLAALNRRFLKTNMSVREYNLRLSNMIRQQRKASTSTMTLNERMTKLRSTMVGLTASMTAFAAGADIVKTGQTLERLDIALKAVFGDSERAAQEMAFFNKVVDETGVNLVGATKGFKNFIASSKGAGFDMQEARNIFESVSRASVVLGVSVDDTEGIFRALSQMISKSTVQSEELKGQ